MTALVAVLLFPDISQAANLQVQPTLYRESLQPTEKKKGYIDIANPSGEIVTVHFSVSAFRQSDDKGALTFHDNEQVVEGVKLDLSSVDVKPRENVRLYFLLDGTKLPSGDVFAVIFATIDSARLGVASARVGTLLVLQNGTPSSHEAAVDDISAPLFQVGESIEAVIRIRNTAPSEQATGFFPSLHVSLAPYSSRTVDGPLIFAGHSRTIAYREPGNYVGPMRVTVTTGSSTKYAYVFAVTGYWRWAAPVILLIVGAGLYLIFCRKRRKRAAVSKKRK